MSTNSEASGVVLIRSASREGGTSYPKRCYKPRLMSSRVYLVPDLDGFICAMCVDRGACCSSLGIPREC